MMQTFFLFSALLSVFQSYGEHYGAEAFQVALPSNVRIPSSLFSTKAESDQDLEASMDANLEILYRAADTKDEEADKVYQALVDLEKQVRIMARQDESFAPRMQEQLTGDWRLIFTTGTVKTQDKLKGKINYFPIKAVQSFDTTVDPMTIENGIYLGPWAVLKFSGEMDFDLRKRRVNFDFDQLALFDGLAKFPLKKGEAASLGSKSGLGSEGNVANVERKSKPAFFNWISADEKVATARGGGGGLALWKRVDAESE